MVILDNDLEGTHVIRPHFQQAEIYEHSWNLIYKILGYK